MQGGNQWGLVALGRPKQGAARLIAVLLGEARLECLPRPNSPTPD